MKILTAEEHDGIVTASVEFPDGDRQTVVLPAWASKKNIKDEADRLRELADARQADKKVRNDLVG